MKELAQGIASLGRGPDTELVHMTKGEIAAMQRLAQANGASLTINPHTGLPEAGILSSILPMLAGAATMAFTGSPWGSALAGGLAGAATSKNKLMGAGLGALGGYGGGNLANTFMNAGQGAQAASLIENTAPVRDAATQSMQGSNILSQYDTSAISDPYSASFDPNTADAITNSQQIAANQAQAANQNYAQSVDDFLKANPRKTDGFELMKAGFGAMPKDQLLTKKNGMDLGMGLAPVAASALGLGGGTAAQNMGYPGYSSSYVARGPKSRATTNYTGQTGNGEKTYFSDSGLGYFGASGGLATQQGFANGGMSGELDLNFANTGDQYPVDKTQQSLDNRGEPMGYADGGGIMRGRPNITQAGIGRFPPPYSREGSGFWTQGPQRATPAHVPFSLYGPGGFKPAAVQIAPPTQTQATTTAIANAPPPAPAPAPAPVPVVNPTGIDPSYDAGYGGGSGAKNGGRIAAGIGSLPNTYAAGGRLLRGPGDGVSDSIPAVIDGPKPQRAALADGEFVIPARIVSELGNGSTEAGARKLYAMMDRVQHARKKTVGKSKVAVNSRAEKLLPA
jgi:hypothetical protein